MSRRQRRPAVKLKAYSHVEAPQDQPAAKPGLVLRLLAPLLLAPWVLKRIKHPDVERLLAGVAIQAGRPEVAEQIINRLVARDPVRR